MAEFDNLDTLDSGSLLEGQVDAPLALRLTALRIVQLFLVVSGSNTAGSTTQIGDLGRFELFKKKGADSRWGMRLRDLFRIEKERTRYDPTFTSVEGGDISMAVRLDFSLFGLLQRNALYVPEDGDPFLRLLPKSSNAGGRVLNNKASDLTYELKAKVSPAAFEARMIEWSTTPVRVGSVGEHTVNGLEEQNIPFFFIDDPNGAVDAVTVERVLPTGREHTWDERSVEEVQEEYRRRAVPAGSSNLIGVDLMQRPVAAEAFDQGVDVTLHMGSADDQVRIIYPNIDAPVHPESVEDARRRADGLKSLMQG